MSTGTAESAEPIDGLATMTAVLADNKYLLGRRLSEWGVGAPALESAVACMAIAQEELGHARGLYSMLETLPTGSPLPMRELDSDAGEEHGVSFILHETRSWYDAVVALVLLDGALTVFLESAKESVVEDLRKRALRILGDEDFHWKYTVGRVRELLANDAEARLLEAKLAGLLPEMLCWFGPSSDPGTAALVDAGVLDRDGDAMRVRLLDRLATLAETTGLRLPVSRAADGRWNHGELPWTEWNPRSRRLDRTTRRAPGAGRVTSSASANTARAS